MNFSLTREYDWLIPQPLERTPHSSQPCERITANLTAAFDGGQDGNLFGKYHWEVLSYFEYFDGCWDFRRGDFLAQAIRLLSV